MAGRLFSTFLIISTTFSLLNYSLASNILYSGEYLRAGEEINEGSCGLAMQTDCNLVLYNSGNPIWASNTARQGENCYLYVGYSGGLGLYSGKNNLWSSNTRQPKEDNYFIVVTKRDCAVKLYGSDLWSTKRKSVGTANVTISSNSTEPVVIAGDKISMVTDTEK